jgi:prophage tail gpP-like protein
MSFYTIENGFDLQSVSVNKFLNLKKEKKSPLKIEINGKEFSEFNALRLSYAIDSGCAAFSFDTIFNPSKGLSNDIKPFGNEPIKIYYKEESVFNGILEKITTGYSNSGSNINIQGRSKSGILLDTQVKGSQLANSTIEGLSQTFGFTEIKEKTKEIFPLFDWNSGDNAFDIISKYAAQKGYWAVPRFDGSLEFINFNKLTDPKISIQDGKENVLSISSTYDVTKRFSEYVGFKKGFAQKIVTDNTISNRGKKYFRGDDNNSDLDKVAQLGRSKSISESMTFSVVLSTWEWDKKLFQPGILLNVTSPMNLIYKESKFCVKQVDFTYDINSGYITELQLCLPSVFTLENPDLEFFKTFKDLSLKDKASLKSILGIPNNELYKTSLEYFTK